MIHTLARVDSNGGQSDVDQQQVPAYNGMQACLNQAGERRKAYYQSNYPETPSKSVINDFMVRNIQGTRQKNNPFLFMVGDLPTYVHIVELKSENSVQFEKVVSVLGPFHQQLSFIYCIYKRYCGLGIIDVLVSSAGVIAEGSVDQVLHRKNYQCGVRCITLMREALIHSQIKEFLSPCIVPEKTENFI